MIYRHKKDGTTKVYKNMPKGWKVLEGTMTEPVGTCWIVNDEPFFKKNGKMQKNPKRKQALLVTNEELLISRIAENRCYRQDDGFELDKKTEARVTAEMKRQERARRKWGKEREKRMAATEKRLAAKKSSTKKSPSSKRRAGR